jgi:hypothetical protein
MSRVTSRSLLRPALLAAAAAAGLGTVIAPVATQPASAASATDAMRDKIVKVALDELQNPTHNHETYDNCNYYSGFFNRGNTIDRYGNRCPKIDGVQWRSEAWCADFAQFTWKVGGANTGGLTAAANSFPGYGRSHGTWHAGLAGVRPGDAVYFENDPGTPDDNHVAIVTSVDSTGVWTVGGNTGPNTQHVYKNHYPNATGYTSPVR